MTTPAHDASPDIAKLNSDTDSTDDPIFTPPDSEYRFPASHLPEPPERRNSPSPLRLSSLPANIKEELKPERQQQAHLDEEKDASGSESGLDEDEEGEMAGRPGMHRPSGGFSHTPLLRDDKDGSRGRADYESPQGSARPPFAARRNTFRSRSPTYVEPVNSTRRKYIYAAFFLGLSLISFVVQTETAVYIQHELKWNKHYAMLWLTHSSWSLLWPMQLLIIRIQKRKLSWPAFWRRHKYLIRTTAQMVQSQDLHLTRETTSKSPWPYMFKTTAFVTTFLTVAGGSWYVAIDMTSPSDLTAIYNCSAFFAYVFSIWLLHDKLRFDKMFSVGLAIVGVLVVAYGDKEEPKTPGQHGGASGGKPGGSGPANNRLLGNIIIGIGSVLYGLYEVLYKKLACPPEGTSPGRGMIFANTFGSMIGLFTFTVLWIPLPVLHFTGIEPFELPHGEAAGLLAISTLSNAIFSGSFLVLMSLTSPVLSSVAALLTIFLVAIVDWLITNKPLSAAAIVGGCLIIVAFVMLSWATYREMDEERKKREEEEVMESDIDEDA
jgi:drug/metabolite transporter (DMT)-like permease